MTEEAKTEKAPLKLARGRMPAPVVYLVKFESEDESDTAIAHKYFTTPGKISDIRKGRNFGYIDENTRFTQAQIDDAIERVKTNFSSEKSDTTIEDAEYVLEKLQELEVGTEDDAKALEEARAAARKTKGEPKAAKKDEPKDEEVVEEPVEDDLDDLMANM